MNADTSNLIFTEIYRQVRQQGKLLSSRPDGLSGRVLELESFTYQLPPRVRFANFEARKLNLNYIKREMLWYLRGRANDLEILPYAKIWQGLVTKEGTINSNYGQYFFGYSTFAQFDGVLKELKSNKFSRRAAMVILRAEHLADVNSKDYPCTYALSFRIRPNAAGDEVLNMHVHMRSQDAIYGMGNDAPAFSFIHEMVWGALLEVYPELQLGTYTHTADSFHVYEKHFEVLDKLSEGSKYLPVDCPAISGPVEVEWLRGPIHLTYDTKVYRHNLTFILDRGLTDQERTLLGALAAGYKFASWLTTFDPPTQKDPQ